MMIFRLICVVIIASIIIEINSSPVSKWDSDSDKLNDDDYNCDGRRMSSERDPDDPEDPSDRVFSIAETIQKAVGDRFRQIRRNTFKFIDNSGKALETAVRISKGNLLKTIDPVKNALKANMNAAQRLGALALSTVAQVPAFGVRIMQNFSDDSDESNESDGYLE